MWTIFLALSIFCFLTAVLISVAVNRKKQLQVQAINCFNILFAGVYLSAFLAFLPTHVGGSDRSVFGCIKVAFLSFFNAIQVFTAGADFENVTNSLAQCDGLVNIAYQVWVAFLFVMAPIFTFGFVLSLFKNASAYFKYFGVYFRDIFVFSELNEKSLALAGDIKANHPKAAIVFTDVFEDNEENIYEMMEQAKDIGAICFKKDILVVNFHRHAARKSVSFFTIGNNETENLNQALKLIARYKNRENTRLYIFSTMLDSELLLTAVDKGKMKVRRINEVQSLISRILYERGHIIFDGAHNNGNTKTISAVVVGLGNYGTEMLKTLSWYGQMDGYRLKINAFDKDSLAEEKFCARAPELMDATYNGAEIAGTANYHIAIHSGMDVQTLSFAKEIRKITDATYVFVALGNDDENISTAVMLRTYFERMGLHPSIHAVVKNAQQSKALKGIVNFRKQPYDVEFVGDIDSSFTEAVIIDHELEDEGLAIHMKWGAEEEFWTYEYNYRSSIASAIHMKARIHCGIPGAGKKEEDLTDGEKDIIAGLEHRRWNAYMRSEGYVHGDARNDLAKVHHNLTDYSKLDGASKHKTQSVGTK